jgi:hypothetical protein
MSKQMLEIRSPMVGTAPEDPFLVTIEGPEQDPVSGDHFCRVSCSHQRLGFRLDVYGVTPEQAIRLALEMTAAKLSNILLSELMEAEPK